MSAIITIGIDLARTSLLFGVDALSKTRWCAGDTRAAGLLRTHCRLLPWPHQRGSVLRALHWAREFEKV